MTELELKYRPIDGLIPYARNSRTHTEEQVAQIAGSIREFGFTNPVLIDEEGGIIAGHGRVLAAIKLEMEQVPTIVLAGLNEAQRRAYVIADNKLALNAGWDMDMLRVEMESLQEMGFDLDLVGFSSSELEDLFFDDEEAGAGLTDPDDVPDVDAPVSQPGDVWVLGTHRVRCGDVTHAGEIEALMDGLMADACWTDPPYNVDYSSKAGKIANDNQPEDEFASFLQSSFSAANVAMKPGAPIYVCHADTAGLTFRSAFSNAGFKISGCLIWSKDSLVLGRSDYQWQHEPILYGWKLGAKHKWYGGRKKTTVLESESSIFTKNEDGTVTVSVGGQTIVLSGENLEVQPVASTIIRCEKPKRSAEHPTMKPVELINQMLRNSTREGDIVLDMFGGSGSTLIACETLGRQARLLEVDPRYVDVIVKRWEKFTGKNAVLSSENMTFSETAEWRSQDQSQSPQT